MLADAWRSGTVCRHDQRALRGLQDAVRVLGLSKHRLGPIVAEPYDLQMTADQKVAGLHAAAHLVVR